MCLVLFAQCLGAQEEPCRDGRILLFYDDFGGNDPKDPIFYTESHPNIINYINGGGQQISRGMYAITKKGLQPGDWHVQDDYTHPHDYSRGYFLEVDGSGQNDPFYVVRIDHLYANEKLRFSARVVNINIRNNSSYVCPSVQIVLVNADTEERLDSISTGCLEADTTAAKDESAAWQLLEMDYIVPLDVSSIKMYLYNNVNTAYKFGNDFAVDDIDISIIVDPNNCEYLYPLVVNKYNWLLLCDNTALNDLFPQSTPVSYQWYKDGKPINGANIDDYSGFDELHGSYQLCIGMSDGTYVWSDIVDIPDTRVPSPVRVQIYDSRGVPVREEQVRHGIYLYRYEQDDHVWTEKKLIP